MKRKYFCLVLLIVILFLPLLVFAEEEETNSSDLTSNKKCTIINGNGKNIGDEIACDSEYFYVISNDGENVKMLAKYNLMVGYTFDLIEFPQTFSDLDSANVYFDSNYGENYDWYERYLQNSKGEYYGVIAPKPINVDKVVQDPLAIGAHGDKHGKPEFPEIGVWPYGNVDDAEVAIENSTPYSGGYVDFEFLSDTSEKQIFDEYKNNLIEMGFEVSNISTLAVSDIDNIVFQLTGDRLPLEEWWEKYWQELSDGFHDTYYVVGSFKSYLPEGYEWLYSTTYWTRTVEPSAAPYQYFVDTLGNICNGWACDIAVGAGIRPVITTPASNLVYNIATKTDGNVEVTASHVTSESGQEIEFTVTPKEGYLLKRVLVTTESGEILEFTDYKFRMPDDNVEIYAEFEKIVNPTTGFVLPIAIIIGCIMCGVFVHLSQKENSYSL